ncbi:MAG TPA: winged helix-turn-helix transcriptional regulator [Solirubrobacterales bacterium]|nr:winged helix-turn-helix transcriptional regulator [Solirubrobacterales bacterium]
MLRLLSAGASGAILMALGEGPLRTKELTARIAGYAPRTIYRYSTRLADLGLIDRDEEQGVPSKVVHTLSEPAGRELYELVSNYASASLRRLPSGEIAARDWGALAVVADFWETGIIDALNIGPRSLTELTHGDHGLSFHQISRRAALLSRDGFIDLAKNGSKHRSYTLTAKARRAMGLVAGIGRWRRRHVVSEGSGLSPTEAAWLMRTALPLVALPDHSGKSLELKVAAVGEAVAVEPVWAAVQRGGAVINCPDSLAHVDVAAHGDVIAWIDSVLDGPRNGLKVDGDDELIVDCLQQLHATLFGNSNGFEAGDRSHAANQSGTPKSR